jgi:hypothetical protein
MGLMQSIALPAWTEKFKAVTAKCHQCNRSLALSHSSTRKAGIKMHDNWYCSSRCFQAAAEEELASLATSSRPQRTKQFSRMPLALLMVRYGLLSSTQFKEMKDEQKEAGEEIGEFLVRQGSVSEKQLTAVRATQWGYPVFTVPEWGMPTEIHIPPTFVRLYSMIPLHYVATTNMLLVGFVHGVEYGLLYAIEKITGCKTQPCFVTPSDFQNQVQYIEQVNAQSEDETPTEIKFESAQSSSEMARILCSYSVQLEADEAVIGRCKEYLWARLKCSSKDVDLLFKAG